MAYPNKDTYQGVFNKNRRHGDGTYTYASTGDRYSGSWVDDARAGWGAYVFGATGVQLVGEWRAGGITSGKWIMPDGTSFHGRFAKGGKPSGRGVFYFRGGNQQEGAFEAVTGEDGDDEDPDAPKPTRWVGGKVLKASVECQALLRAQADPTAPDRALLLVLEAQSDAFVKFQAKVRDLFYNADVEALQGVSRAQLHASLSGDEALLQMAEAAGRPRSYVLDAIGTSEEEEVDLKGLVEMLTPLNAAIARLFARVETDAELRADVKALRQMVSDTVRFSGVPLNSVGLGRAVATREKHREQRGRQRDRIRDTENICSLWTCLVP